VYGNVITPGYGLSPGELGIADITSVNEYSAQAMLTIYFQTAQILKVSSLIKGYNSFVRLYPEDVWNKH
jgi:hypothetical protein